MLSDYYFITLKLDGYSWICLVILFFAYNFALVQFAPDIKKWIKEKTYRKSDNIGFK